MLGWLLNLAIGGIGSDAPPAETPDCYLAADGAIVETPLSDIAANGAIIATLAANGALNVTDVAALGTITGTLAADGDLCHSLDPLLYANSIWNEDGTINCSGIIYCGQNIIC